MMIEELLFNISNFYES